MANCHGLYYDYPLEQGLRHISDNTIISPKLYYDYPLEQGLRHKPIQVWVPAMPTVL